ncbi:MAG: NifB/NifX family molybdenum-iron cluster-binding protein [Balneolales bacterium]
MSNKKYFCMMLFLGALILQIQPGFSLVIHPDTVNAKSSNKIAVAAVGDNINSEISRNAGRALYYLIFDENGVYQKAIKNTARNRRGGASMVVIDLLLQESCKTVIAENFGANMLNQLKANEIEYFEREGIVKNVVHTLMNEYKNGT